MPVAIVTGASKGLGRALAEGLSARGWDLVLDARTPEPLERAVAALPGPGRAVAVPGDVTRAAHRGRLLAAADRLGGVSLVVNNASALGAEPLVPLGRLPEAGLRAALETNVVAPAELVRAALPALRERRGAVLNVSSDAAVGAYPSWGGYGASKAALEQWSAVLAQEEPGLRVWWVDPGDLRTGLYEAACPDDPRAALRPEPGAVAPVLLGLLDAGAASGRYAAAELAGVA
jgi:NAD(P)-dependent dehydrogenase (short-subunit alcohol dehydrogenase family)